MAFTPPSSLLLLRSFSSKNPNFHSRITYLVRATRALWFSNVGGNGEINHFSTSQSSSSPSPLQHSEADLPNLSSDPKRSLSARMSFVFDQIDAMERERSEKDEALQRIRSWRDSRKKKIEEESSKLGNSESVDTRLSSETEAVERKREESLVTKKEVEVVHPWPEWIELMERLVQQNYFDHRRTDEEKMMQDLSIDVSGFAEEGCDFTRDWTTVRTACLNFGRDRFDILKSLSRQDLQILVGYGCPSSDKKVVFSAKMLRKHVHLDEGDVCSSCSLRSSCEKAYLLSRKEDEARTLDVMRVLLTFGFDPINGSVENKSLLKLKSVRTVVRKLLHEVVKLSAVPIDPNLPLPVIKKPPPKIKQPPPPPKKRVGRDDIEMKKGDWLCPKCDFMNFAKNTVCLQCDAKRPKRQLLPGEWECPECNFLNYRRNMACFHCDHKRPPDEFMENQLRSRPSGLKSRLEKVADMPGVSNAWNFDFDDNESDGADVAAFEYADPPRIAQDFSMENHAQMESTRGAFEDDSFENSQVTRANGRDKYSNLNQRKSGAGFDDFDDEEDDDIDSYEIDTSHGNPIQKASSKDFSQSEGFSESEDFDSSDQHLNAQRGNASSHHKLARAMPVRGDFSGSRDQGKELESDEELSTYPNRRSSHIAGSRHGTRNRGGNGPYREINFGSNDDLESISDSDNDTDRGLGHKKTNRDKWGSNGRNYRRRADNGEFPFDSESNDDDDLPSSRNKMRGRKAEFGRRGSSMVGHDHFESARDVQFRNNGRTNNRRNFFGNGGRDRSSHRNGNGPSHDGYDRKSMDERRGNMRHFGRKEAFGPRAHGKRDLLHDRSEMGQKTMDGRPRRRVIER